MAFQLALKSSASQVQTNLASLGGHGRNLQVEVDDGSSGSTFDPTSVLINT